MEIQYEEVKVETVAPVGLEKLEDEDIVKTEIDDTKVGAGLTVGEERVLGIVDQVDGVDDIGE